MNLTQEQIIQLIGLKELDNYTLRLQVQQLSEELQKEKQKQTDNNNE